MLVPDPVEESENVPGSTIFKNLVDLGTKTRGWCPKNHQLTGKWWILGQTAVQPDDVGDVEAAWRKDLAQRPGATAKQTRTRCTRRKESPGHTTCDQGFSGD